MNHYLKIALLACAASLLPGAAHADLTALVVSEPTSRKDVLMVSKVGLESQLTKAAGQNVTVVVSEDLTDAMRATRAKGYDLYVAPAQVAASAIAHGHELIGSTAEEEDFVLVGGTGVSAVGGLRKGRIYLPQQDSIYTYLGRGMLNASGLSFKDLSKVQYERYPQAGLTAIALRLSEATVTRRADFDAWSKDNPGMARVLASAGGVPGGLSVTMSKELAPELRSRLSKWFTGAATAAGLKPVAAHTELAQYRRVAELGTFTPTSLPGVEVVHPTDVVRLLAQGAVLVDTRTEKEFKQRHIPGAVFVPYHEKSLKDVAYDAAQDDFAGLAQLDIGKPVVFHCNGAECWKSYKASKAALAKGFTKVYWFRGGMPEWEKSGQQVAAN